MDNQTKKNNEQSESLFKELDHKEKAEIKLNDDKNRYEKAQDNSPAKTDDEENEESSSFNNHQVEHEDELMNDDQTSDQIQPRKKTFTREIMEYVILFIITIITVNIIHRYVFTPVSVEGRSMMPTLHDKDYLFLWEMGDIDRFDIIVFKATRDDYYVKRVIGLPGDSLQYRNNKLYINGQYYEETFYDEGKKPITNSFTSATVCKETDFENNEGCINGVIPEGYYLVLGDNRANSTDSREIGLINDDTVLGKTKFILYPFDRIGTVD